MHPQKQSVNLQYCFNVSALLTHKRQKSFLYAIASSDAPQQLVLINHHKNENEFLVFLFCRKEFVVKLLRFKRKIFINKKLYSLVKCKLEASFRI